MNAIAHIDVKASGLPKYRFVAGGAVALAVAGGLALAIRNRFHNHVPQQRATLLALHRQATDELGPTCSAGRGGGTGERAGYGSVLLGAGEEC